MDTSLQSMSQLQYTEEDSQASGDTLQTMSQLQHTEKDSQAGGETLHPSYNTLRKTHRPVETPCIPATTC